MDSERLKLEKDKGKWRHKKGGIVILTRNQAKKYIKPDKERHILMLKVTIQKEDITKKLQEK